MCTQPAQFVIIDNISPQKVVAVSIFDTWKNFFDFSDYIVRHGNSSVHVQGLYRPYERSRLQTKMIDNWSTQYRPASYGYARTRNLN